jgi:hypothetical protein
MPRPSKTYEANHDSLPPGRSFALSEIGDPGPIELVSERDFVKEADLESFMNEELEIRIHDAVADGDLLIETPSLNGINMPIIRGQRQRVKRKYVEVLAQARTITFVQEARNPIDPSDIAMVERSRLSYPFEVLHDPNPKGRAWLEAQLAQH